MAETESGTYTETEGTVFITHLMQCASEARKTGTRDKPLDTILDLKWQ